jgi:hypothetical protein
MCRKKVCKGNANIVSVYEKTVYQNIEQFLPFLTSEVLKKSLCPFLEEQVHKTL